jgi:hypothetical protein
MAAPDIAAGGWSDPRKLDRSDSGSPAAAYLGGEERKTIKASKFSDAQKAFILKQGADGISVAEISPVKFVTPDHQAPIVFFHFLTKTTAWNAMAVRVV